MKTENNNVDEKYFHIDNGGFTFTVTNRGQLEIEFGFNGYSNTKILLCPERDFSIKNLAEF